MNVHRRIVAIGLRVLGVALALEPAYLLALTGMAWWDLRHIPPPDDSPPLDPHTYGVWAALDWGGKAFDHVMYAMAAVSAWLLLLVAIVCAVGLVIALIVYLTGRGVGRRQTWARLMAVLVFVTMVGAPATLAPGLDHSVVPLVALPILAGLYGLWVVIWRYD